MPKVTVIQPGSGRGRQRRRHRRPQEPFNIRSRPFEITPFMIHPVLPNETMDNLLFQVDAYSDPIVNRNIGWHAHYQFYYVPHMAIANMAINAGNISSDDIAAMHLDTSFDMNSVITTSAASVPNFQYKGAVPWLEECMALIVNRFYRNESDLTGYAAASGMEYPLAYINQASWINSLTNDSNIASQDDPDLPGEDEVEDLDILSGYSANQTAWEAMRDSGKEDLSYDDYLNAQGVRLSRSERYNNDASGETAALPEPELLRFVRKWVKPVSTFDPTDGSPASALKWNCSERADKKRYFKEPGFLVGVAVTTPKLYLGNQKGAIVGALSQAEHWLPKVLQGYGYTSVTEVLDSVTDGPLINQTDDYWFDIADLFNYGGGGFFNHAVGAGQHILGVPDVGVAKHYLTEAEIKSLFVDSTNDQHIYQDGTVHLDILTTVPADTTGPGQ